MQVPCIRPAGKSGRASAGVRSALDIAGGRTGVRLLQRGQGTGSNAAQSMNKPDHRAWADIRRSKEIFYYTFSKQAAAYRMQQTTGCGLFTRSPFHLMFSHIKHS